MFDLNEAQEEFVEQSAEALKPWFLDEGFPQVLATLADAEQSWNEKHYPKALTIIDSGFQELTSNLLIAFEPYAVPFLLGLNEENLSHFRAYTNDKKEDWFEHAKSTEAKVESRVERFENWFGDLSDAQVTLVKKHIEVQENEFEIRVANTDNWVDKLISAVRSGDEAIIRAWVLDPSVWWTSDYTNLREANRLAIRSGLFELSDTLTSRQATHALDEAQEWQDTLREVIEDYLADSAP
jgi:hypothetical protein